jgi:hypothetical protein
MEEDRAFELSPDHVNIDRVVACEAFFKVTCDKRRRSTSRSSRTAGSYAAAAFACVPFISRSARSQSSKS